MTQRRGEWLETLTTKEARSDLYAAARACMREADDCPPELCEHQVNRMTPLEFVEWIELKGRMEQRRPVRFERGFRPRAKKTELSLIRAG